MGTVSTKVFLLDVGNFFEINDKELLAVEMLVPTLYYKQKFTVRYGTYRALMYIRFRSVVACIPHIRVTPHLQRGIGNSRLIKE